MSKTKKIWIIIAISCIGAGLVITILSFAFVGFDFMKLNNIEYEEKTYNINNSFENIDIKTTESDVIFIPYENNECKVICKESEKIKYNVSVENNTLYITRIDTRKWYEHITILNYIKDAEIKVYLPENEYTKLYISSVSGDISIPDNFTFAETDLTSTSGDIKFDATTKGNFHAETVSGDLYIKNIINGSLTANSTSGKINISDISAKSINTKTVSGDIVLKNINTSENIEIKSTSGKINISNISAKLTYIKTTSGDIQLNDTITTENIIIESISGDVSLINCDSEDIKITTVSGDVNGSLLSNKHFITNTTSGDVRLPDSTSLSQKCYITTTSGDISFTIKP